MPVSPFTAVLVERAATLIAAARAQGVKLATAESCTGGLVAALLTEIPGSSAVVDRGFVTYSNEAKTEMLGVPAAMIRQFGAVSTEVARAMATGAISASGADVAVSITGIAGPGGGSAEKPVGLVQFAAVRRGAQPIAIECRFGDLGRPAIREAAVDQALTLFEHLLTR